MNQNNFGRFILCWFLFAISAAAAAPALAAAGANFVVQYNDWETFYRYRNSHLKKDVPEVYVELDLEFQASLDWAYDFLTQRMRDPVDRSQCPIRIRFIDFKGEKMAFTPKYSEDCKDQIILDSSLERNWMARYAVVHELTHLLHHHYNPNEELWLDEGMAKLLEVEATATWNKDLEQQLKGLPDFVLSNSAKDYTFKGQGYVTSYFFILYLYNRFGRDEFLHSLLESPKIGWDNVLNAIEQNVFKIFPDFDRELITRQSVWLNFSVALILNDYAKGAFRLYKVDDRFHSLNPKDLSRNASTVQMNSLQHENVVSEIKFCVACQGHKLSLFGIQPGDLVKVDYSRDWLPLAPSLVNEELKDADLRAHFESSRGLYLRANSQGR